MCSYFFLFMAKKIKGFVKLALTAGKATPAPPVGPALGQFGVNIQSFCKDYNAKTADQIGFIIPVKITIYEDKSYSFILKTPPASTLLLKYANIKKGSATPNRQISGSISVDQLTEIAKLKLADLNTNDLLKAICIVKGTAKNMGISIKNN